MNRRRWYLLLGFVLAGLVGAGAGWLFLGGDVGGSLLLSFGIAAGTYLGVSAGGNEATKVAEYREKWLKNREHTAVESHEENHPEAPPT